MISCPDSCYLFDIELNYIQYAPSVSESHCQLSSLSVSLLVTFTQSFSVIIFAPFAAIDVWFSNCPPHSIKFVIYRYINWLPTMCVQQLMTIIYQRYAFYFHMIISCRS